MHKSRYGNTELNNENLLYPFNGPIKYDYNYTGTYSKFSLIDKYYIDNLVKPHKRLISGGAEWASTGNGSTFSVSNIVYSFNGEILTYNAGYPGLSFDNGDSNDRIDALVINEDNQIAINRGTASITPPKPVISDNQILIQYAYISANSTSIGASEAVYINNSQWNTSTYQTSGTLSGTVNLASTNDYYLSSVCVDVNTDYRTGIKFTKPSGYISTNDYASITMHIKLTSIVSDNTILVAQLQGISSGYTMYSNTINLMTYGLDRDNINTWQHIVIPVSRFGSNLTLINSITLSMVGGLSVSNNNWRVDYIFFQKGVPFDGYMGEPDTTSSISANSTIGPAEDGTYTDGVFSDFTPNTPVGTAIDRFNELLVSLVPPKAPILSDWSGARSGGSNGKLSFDTSNPISGSTYYGADTAPSNPISVDGTWISSSKRLSIYAGNSTQNLTGTLNSQVSANTSTPTPAYPAASFGDADLGTLKLSINGVLVSTATLTTLTALDNTSGSSISGFVLSAATGSKFPVGTSFDQFKYRTGTWLVKYNDPNLRYGYNYITTEHDSTSFTRILSRYEFIIDNNTDSTLFSNYGITASLSGSKFLSGISFYTGGTLYYNAQIDNLYKNTYYSGTDAISFVDNSGSGNAWTNPIINVSTSYSLPNSLGNESKSLTYSTDLGSGSPITFNILTGKRRLNDSIGLYSIAKRTVQGNKQGATSSISNIYLDNVSATSTDLYEGFDDETKRLKTGSYDLLTDVTSGTWDSTQSLLSGDSNHNTGLQVINSSLIYPITNYSTVGSLSTNLNFGNSGTIYSSATGQRSYYRYFKLVSPSTGNFKINITGSGGTFVSVGTSLTSNNIHVEFKLPGSSIATTGWMDAYSDFATGLWTDGSGGRKASNGVGQAFSTDWGLTVGTKNTSTSGGYVIIRITVGSSFTGQINDMTFTFI
jgi:hypothetical protein